jgi:hypothetical protein
MRATLSPNERIREASAARKDGLAGTLLAMAFAIYSLVSLISENPSWDSASLRFDGSRATISDLGLRYRMHFPR